MSRLVRGHMGVVLLTAFGLALVWLVVRPAHPSSPLGAPPTKAGRSSGVVAIRPPYPRGAFDWCPNIAGTRPVAPGVQRVASRTAVAFDVALHHGGVGGIGRLVDPTISLHASPSLSDPSAAVLNPIRWSRTTTASDLRVTTYLKAPGLGANGPATTDPLVTYGCGRSVAARTMQVAVKDGSFTSSREVMFFLVHRANGWKVWGSY